MRGVYVIRLSCIAAHAIAVTLLIGRLTVYYSWLSLLPGQRHYAITHSTQPAHARFYYCACKCCNWGALHFTLASIFICRVQQRITYIVLTCRLAWPVSMNSWHACKFSLKKKWNTKMFQLLNLASTILPIFYPLPFQGFYLYLYLIGIVAWMRPKARRDRSTNMSPRWCRVISKEDMYTREIILPRAFQLHIDYTL